MTVSRSTLYCASTWLELRLSFRPSNACCCCGPQVHIFFLLSNSLRGFVWSARWGENLLCWLTRPRNLLSSLTFVGDAICRIALTFSGSGLTPVPSTIWPRNFTLFWLIWHLSRPNVSPAFLHLARTWFNRELCSSWVFPVTRTSSTRHTTPSQPLTPCASPMESVSCQQAISTL